MNDETVVLYVDDSETMQRIAEITLRDTDLVYLGARTAVEAYELALARQPMLVLADAVMPGENGYELCARLKAEPALAGVVVIIVCGNSEAYDPARGARAGADGTIAKPWDTQVLLDKLRALLEAAAEPAPRPVAAPPASPTIMGPPSLRLPAPAKTMMVSSPVRRPVEEPVAVSGLPDLEPDRPRYVDENVQFTIYRPKAMPPGKWHPLLAFAHLADKRDDDDDTDPIEEVQRQARQVLGDDAARFTDTTQDSTASIPAEGELTIVPELGGVDVNPRARTFLWTEAVHREEFRIRAGAALEGQTARGKVTVWLGSLIVAEVPIAIRISSGATASETQPAPAKARPYRKIFASYSHRDSHIVDEVSRLSRALGDDYIRDWVHLRSGQVWNDQLRTLIAEADIFQLFWSSNSMRSRYCREEWEYALSLGRRMFVRPTYWEDPLPRDDGAGMPPEELVRLHFQKIRVGVDWAPPPAVQELREERKERVALPAPSPPPPPPGAMFSAGVGPMPRIVEPRSETPPRRPWALLAILIVVIAAAVAWLALR